MYRKNTASQFVCFQMLLTATGAIATGLSPTVRRCIDGTFAAGGGTVTEDTGTGCYKYAMAQADTNGNDISLTFTAATAMPVCINFVTTAADPTNAATFGITDIDATISSRMATYTQPTGFLAATFPSGTIANTTNITSITGNITGNLSGSVGSVTGAVGSVTGAVGSVTAGVTVTTNSDKTGYSLTQAFPTNFSSLGISAGGHISNVDTLTTYTGNTVQTGDAYARLGAPAGASVAADVAAVKTDTAAVKVQTDKMAFTVANKIDANTLSISGNTTSASNVAHTMQAIVRGTCSGGTTATAVCSSITSPSSLTASGQLIGRTILFDADTTTAALQGQASNITASTTGATPTITFTALTTAPANGDTFSIV